MTAGPTTHRRSRPGIATGLLALTVGLGACGATVPPGAASTGQPATGASGPDQGGDELEVRLDLLERAVPDIVVQSRSPFQFDFGGGEPVEPPPSFPDPNDDFGTPTVPQTSFLAPIRLQMIGLVEGKTSTGRIAVLQDGDLVVHGRQGDIVDGRYRVLEVGPRSVEVERLEDGQRRVLRLPES